MLMNVFRALAVTAAGVWLGGMLTIGVIVAKNTFQIMRKTDVAQPNALAGRIMARNFQEFDYVQLACAGILLAWQVAHMLTARRLARDWFRFVLILAAAGLLLYSVLVLTPQIVALQSDVAGAAAEATVRRTFDAFHETSVRIAQVLLGLVFVIAMEMGLPRASAPPKGPAKD